MRTQSRPGQIPGPQGIDSICTRRLEENRREPSELIEREGEAIDVLVSDVIMPHVGGLELVDQVRAVRPELPIILISGYSLKLPPAGTVGEGVILLQKPFTAQRLTEAIRQAMGRESPR